MAANEDNIYIGDSLDAEDYFGRTIFSWKHSQDLKKHYKNIGYRIITSDTNKNLYFLKYHILTH